MPTASCSLLIQQSWDLYSVSYIISVLAFPNLIVSPLRWQEFVGSWVSPLYLRALQKKRVLQVRISRRHWTRLWKSHPWGASAYIETMCTPERDWSWRLEEHRRKPCAHSPCLDTSGLPNGRLWRKDLWSEAEWAERPCCYVGRLLPMLLKRAWLCTARSH